MWNIIRKIREPNGFSSAAVSLQDLEDYFITKFDSPAGVRDYMREETVKVNEQYELWANRIYLNTSVSVLSQRQILGTGNNFFPKTLSRFVLILISLQRW